MSFIKGLGASLAAAGRHLKGYRTYAAFTLTAMVGVVQGLGLMDIRPLLSMIGLGDHKISGIIVGISVLGLVMRCFTTTPPLSAAPPLSVTTSDTPAA